MYFTFEPALATENRFIVPVRWFTRKKAMYAQCWRLILVHSDQGIFWRVIRSSDYEISASELLSPFPELDAEMRRPQGRFKHLPPVSTIRGPYALILFHHPC